MRAFLINLPSCGRYWTVVDDDYRVVTWADGYLRHLRLGQDAAESTTKAYAEALALYLRWCELTSRDWRTAADRLGGFITWLKHTPSDPDAPAAGPGVPLVRGPGRINRILTVVRGFLRHGVALGEVPSEVLAVLYDISDDRYLPDEVRGENPALRYVARPRHRLSETERVIDRATDEEVLALLRSCCSARDRFIVMAMARAGLRRGELVGLRREDVHFVADATLLGCAVPRAHLHVRRRDNPNGAWAKSRRARAVPADDLLVLAYDSYCFEREECRPARRCDFVLVNLFREPVGAPMRPGAINELLTALSRRARLGREVHPHMLRHAFASNVQMSRVASGASFGKIRELILPATSPFGLDQSRLAEIAAHASDQAIDPAVALNATMLYPIRWHPVPDSGISCNCKIGLPRRFRSSAPWAPAVRVDLPLIHRGAFAGLEHCSLPVEAGGALDEAQSLLGHAAPSSTQVYLHPSHDRLRAAVERVATTLANQREVTR